MILAVLACTRHPEDTGYDANVDTRGSAWCDADDALPLGARGGGVGAGVVGVWFEAVADGAVVATHVLDEVDYYEWEGTYALDPWADCPSAAEAAWRLRFALWEGSEQVEEVDLRIRAVDAD